VIVATWSIPSVNILELIRGRLRAAGQLPDWSMSEQRSRFAGGDQVYLRDVQYRDAARLTDRANLHAKYSTAAMSWFDHVSRRIDLMPSIDVLEAGCGAGWMWAESATPVPTGVRITLSDLSPGMVDSAVERVEGSGRFARVTGRTADLQDLPFEADSYDRVVANHMLYHLPDPARGVAELARVVRGDGMVIAATNGRGHMRELWSIRSSVFGTGEIDTTIEVFGADTGFAILRDHFADVRWSRFIDELRCTDPDDVVAYICSNPPGEDATPDQLARLREEIDRAFEVGGGAMRISKDVGCFTCRSPLR
jgi:SAM-dependent methyltransferase